MKIKLFTIPNLLTLANLLCGSVACVEALVYGNLTAAFWLIVAAGVFDFLDGFVARLLHSSSEIGVQLDSLSDMISFGFAPAAMLFAAYSSAPQLWAWNDTVTTVGQYALFIVAAFSALRLAKFNIDQSQKTEFCGLPTPANAFFCASLAMLAVTGAITLPRELMLLIAVVMSCLLISPVRMFSLKFQGFGWRGNEVRYLFLLIGAVLIVLLWHFAIPAIILLYIVISLVRWIGCRASSCDKA